MLNSTIQQSISLAEGGVHMINYSAAAVSVALSYSVKARKD